MFRAESDAFCNAATAKTSRQSCLLLPCRGARSLLLPSKQRGLEACVGLGEPASPAQLLPSPSFSHACGVRAIHAAWPRCAYTPRQETPYAQCQRSQTCALKYKHAFFLSEFPTNLVPTSPLSSSVLVCCDAWTPSRLCTHHGGSARRRRPVCCSP